MEIWDRERALADNGLNIELDSFALKMRHKSLLLPFFGLRRPSLIYFRRRWNLQSE